MPLADVDVQRLTEVVVARVDGEIDMSNAQEVGQAIAGQLTNEELGLVLDLRDVGYIDSAGIRVIYDLRERLATRGQDMVLVFAPRSTIADALRFAGMPGAVAVAETPEAARRQLGR